MTFLSKTGGKRRTPTPRQLKLLEGLAQGKSTRQAALAAGYSARMADHASELLSTSAISEQLATLLAPVETIATRINEGIDAVVTETFSHVLGSKVKGDERIEIHHVDKISWSERRRYLELALRLMGLMPGSHRELEGSHTTPPRRVVVEHVRVDQLDSA